MFCLNSTQLLHFLLIYLILINICQLNAKQRYNANASLSLTALPLIPRILNNTSQEVVVAAASISLGYNMKNKKNSNSNSNSNTNNNNNNNNNNVNFNFNHNTNNNNRDKDNIVIGFLAEYSQMRVSCLFVFFYLFL